MSLNGGLGAIVIVLGAVAVWLYAVLRKLKKYENKEFLDTVYKNAESDIHGKSLDELIADSERRRLERDSKTGSRD